MLIELHVHDGPEGVPERGGRWMSGESRSANLARNVYALRRGQILIGPVAREDFRLLICPLVVLRMWESDKQIMHRLCRVTN